MTSEGCSPGRVPAVLGVLTMLFVRLRLHTMLPLHSGT